jgi:hypothetical protein
MLHRTAGRPGITILNMKSPPPRAMTPDKSAQELLADVRRIWSETARICNP